MLVEAGRILAMAGAVRNGTTSAAAKMNFMVMIFLRRLIGSA
jgi:hypothetical protein